MKIKGYSKKQMFGLLLLPALACTMADGIVVSPARALTVSSSTLTTTQDLGTIGNLTVTSTGKISVISTKTQVASPSATVNTSGITALIDASSYSAILNNEGTIEAVISADASASGSPGAFASAYGYTAYGISMGDIDISATLSNTGTASAIRATIDVDATADGITSAQAGASGYSAYGIKMGALNGSLSNAGTIEANIMATATATATGNGTTGEAYAQAYGFTAYGIDMGGNTLAAGKSLTNSGTISAAIDVGATANETVGTDGGSTDAYATAWNAYGLRLGTLDGALDNSGTLSAITAEMTIAATASGNDVKAYASGGSVYGVNLSGGVTATTGSLNNDGTIRAILDIDATANGVTRATATAQNYWSYGAVNGIRLSNNLSGVLDNSGTIEAGMTMTATAQGDGTANAENAYAYAYGYNAYGLNLATGPYSWMGAYNVDGSLSNTGATSAIRATIDVDATADGITSARASASAYPAFGIKMGALDGSLSNAGTIEASVAADATATATGNGTTGEAYAQAYGFTAYGIDMRNNHIFAGKSLTNSGTISAAIDVGATATETLGTDGGSTDAYATAWNAYGVRLGTLDGALDNSGTLSAITADMSIAATATGDDVKAYASGGTVYGVNLSGGVTATTGNLNNDGTIRATLDIDATANGVNQATATAQNQWGSGGVNGIRLSNNLSGVLENSGTIEANMTMTATAQGDGTTNAANAYAQAYGYNAYGINLATANWPGASAYGVDGSLSNTGATSAIRATIDVDATASGITNARASASGYPAFGIKMGALSGSLSNAGTIEANVMANAMATATGNGSTGEAYAQVYGYTAYGIDMGSNTIAAGKSLTNSGTIKATIDVGAQATETVGTDVGTTDAYATAWNAYGLRLGTLDGTLDNSGTLSAITAEMDIAATATGDDVKAYASGGSVYGVRLGDLTATGSLNNVGLISASITAVAEATASVNAAAYAFAGTSRGPVAGVYISNVFGNATLDNGGNIQGTATAIASATGAATSATASAYAAGLIVDTINSGVALTVTNSGTIQAIASATSTGTATDAAYGAYVGTLNGALNNSNSISGQATLPQDGFSLYVSSGTGVVSNLAGGLLSGNLYTGGSVQVNNSGTIAIPTGVTANVTGNYHQTAGGVLQIGADSTTNFGKLNVGATATFDADSGIDVNVASVNTLVVDNILADVVTAGTLSASTLTVTDNSALLNFAATIDGNTIDLNATTVPVTDIVAGSGAGTLPDLLTEMLNNPDAYPGMAGLLDALNKLETDGDVAQAVNSLLPFLNGDQKRALFSALHETRRIVRVRTDDTRGLNSGDGIAVDRNVWGKVFGSKADQDDSRGVSGYEADSYGIIFGADTELNARTRLGAALAYVKSDVDGDTVASQDAEIDSYQAILYGSHALGEATTLGWQADFARHESDTERAIPFMGLKAKGDYDSWSTHVGIDIDRRFPVGEKTTLIPSARVDYTYLDEDGYTETGAGAQNLKVDSSDVDELIFGIDGKATHNLNESVMLTANLGVAYDALADEESITSAFAGAPGAAFKTTGIDPEPWLVNAGVGVEVGTKDGVQLNVRYDIEDRDDFTNQSVSLKVKVPF